MLFSQVILMLNRHAIMTISNSLQRSIMRPSRERGLGNNRFACARLQPLNCFRPAPYPEMAATGSYVSAVVDPRPRVSTPRPPPLCPRYLNWRTDDKRDRSCQSGFQDGHRLYDSHLPDHTPQLCCGPCLHPQM